MRDADEPRKSRRKRSGRLEIYLDEDHEVLIQRAADLEGRTIKDFVLRSAKAAAERIIQEHAMILLSAQETEALVSAILNRSQSPPEPNASAQADKTHRTGDGDAAPKKNKDESGD